MRKQTNTQPHKHFIFIILIEFSLFKLDFNWKRFMWINRAADNSVSGEHRQQNESNTVDCENQTNDFWISCSRSNCMIVYNLNVFLFCLPCGWFVANAEKNCAAMNATTTHTRTHARTQTRQHRITKHNFMFFLAKQQIEIFVVWLGEQIPFLNAH